MEENKVEENNEDVFYVRNVKKFVKNFEHPKPILRDKTEKNGLEKKRETMSKMSFKKLNDLKKNLQESMQYRYESGSISSVEGKPISQVKEALKKSIENLSARSNLTSPGPKNKDRNTFYRRFSLTAEQIKPFPLPKPRTSLKRKKFKSIPNLSDELIIKEKPEEEKKCFKQPLASADAFSHSKNSNHFSFTFSPSSSPVKPNDINLFLKSHTNNSININDIHNYEFSSHINEQRLSSFNEILRNTKANPKDHQNIQNRDRKSINSVSTPSNTTNTSIELNEKQDKSNINLNENNNSNNKSNDISPSLFSTSSYCSEASDVIERGSYYIYQISINDVDVYHKDNGIDQKIKVGSHVNYNAKIGVGKNGEGESDIGVSNYSDNDIINSNHNVEKSAYKVEKIPIQGIKHIENDDNNRIESSVENNGVDTQANDGDDLTIVKENENSKLLVLSSSSTQSLKEDIDKVKVNKSDIPLQFSHSTEEPVEKVTDTKNELAPRQDLEKNMSLVHNKPCLKVSPLPNTQQQKTELHQSTPQQHVTIEETTGDMTKPSHNHQNFAAIDVSDIIIQAFYTKTTKFFKSCMKHLQKHNHTQNTKDISLLFTSPMAGFERVEDVFDIKFPLPSEEDDDDDGGDNDDDEVKDESSSEVFSFFLF